MKTKEMTQTTLTTANNYGIYLIDIIEFVKEFGYEYIGKSRLNKNYNIHTQDIIKFTDNVTVEIRHGYCPVCNNKCVSFGFSEGGIHSSTCECQTIDYQS